MRCQPLNITRPDHSCWPDDDATPQADVERRIYSATKWVSKRVKGISYDKAVYDGFMSLFRYISGANEHETKIPMTGKNSSLSWQHQLSESCNAG